MMIEKLQHFQCAHLLTEGIMCCRQEVRDCDPAHLWRPNTISHRYYQGNAALDGQVLPQVNVRVAGVVQASTSKTGELFSAALNCSESVRENKPLQRGNCPFGGGRGICARFDVLT